MPKALPDYFGSYEEAIADLYPRLEAHFVLKQHGSFMSTPLDVDGSHARDIKRWFTRTAQLPRPWPADAQDKLFDPVSFLPQDALSMKILAQTQSAYSGKKVRPRVSPIRWLSLDEPKHVRALCKILVKEIGVPPEKYHPHLNATLLGVSAYTFNVDALKIMLQHTQSPQSRLIALPEHLGKKASAWLMGSTLLHRVVQMNAGSGITEDLKKTLDMLIDHDPEMVMVKNHDGHLAEEMDALGDVGNCVGSRRKFYQSTVWRQGLSEIAGDKRSVRTQKRLPKI